MSTVESTISFLKLREGVSRDLPPNLLHGLERALEHCGEEEARHVGLLGGR